MSSKTDCVLSVDIKGDPSLELVGFQNFRTVDGSLNNHQELPSWQLSKEAQL